jgi:Zinc carboxypeptidase/Immune inhibitor A peptidase M6
MPRSAIGLAIAIVVVLIASVPAQAKSSGINAYRVKATATNLEKLALAGFDVTEGRRLNGMIEVYGTRKQMARLSRKTKLRTRIVTDRRGRTSVQRSQRSVRRGLKKLGLRARASVDDPTASASDAAYKVYRKYDAVPGDGHEQYTEFYNRVLNQHDDITSKVVLGQTFWNRNIIAIQVTKDADGSDNGKPAVLYNALQHAREWLAGETCKRTLEYFTDLYGKDRQVTRLVNTRQLWFVCVSNPDGYEFTFTPGNRLWRKNLREQNGQPGIQSGDGVDPNRNFPVDWGLDNEGSSPDQASETYRGTAGASELETQAMLKLWDRVDFQFQKNDHTAAELILYPQGWQQYTPAADDPIFTALAGDDKNPAIQGFDPDLGAELYITNGDTLDTAYNQRNILAYTPEGSEPVSKKVSGFEFEDEPGLIQDEFTDHLAFSLDLAESADDPANPDSHLGNKVENFYVDSFSVSYGDPQTVQVLAKRELGDVVMKYRVNGGAVQTKSTTEWSDGQRYYQEAGAYYHRLRAQVTGTGAGNSVEVWFATANGNRRSESFTYRVASDNNRDVLVLAAEDYTGPTPADADGQPNYRDQYVKSLTDNGFPPDVYDVDAMSRTAPHPLGVLSHYKAVVWYTGNDYLTREPGQVPGTGTSRLALDEIVAVRDYLNEGGKVVLAGKHAGQQYFEGYEFRNYGYPQPNEDQGQGKWCDALRGESSDGCIAHTDDFFQYYMGSYLRVEDGGSWDDATGDVRPVVGVSPFSGTWTPNDQAGDPGAGAPTSTLASTSSLLHTEAYDDFSEVIAGWSRQESGPFSPHSGTHYLYSGTADEAYMRLYQQVTVPQSGDATLKFAASFDTEQDWDFFFVEASPVGSDSWTTLPDANGHSSQNTGQSCWDGTGWGADLHSRLLHYQTKKGDSCTPSGTTGDWHAGTGSSGGWQDWSIDLSAYRGQTIELALVYATDWGVQNLGVWLDDVSLFGGPTVGFEDGTLGGWQRGSLEGSPNQSTWGAQGSTQTFEEGAVIGTKDVRFQDGLEYVTNPAHDTVYAGFELGELPDADRQAFFEEVLEYFELKPPDAE